jgi:TonB family protein
MIRIFFIPFLFIPINLFCQTDSLISYFENNNIESIIYFKNDVRDGNSQFYWENGNIKEDLNYVNGRVEGLVRRYDENGILREMFTIESGKREGPTSLFDSTGTYIDDIYYEEGILVVDKIILDEGPKNETLTSNQIKENKQQERKNIKKENVDPDNPLPPSVEEEHNYEDDPAFYKTVEVMPEPIGGMKAIYKKIGYPEEAKENEIEGIVKILTMIDRDGEVLDAQVIEGIGYGCDEAARLAVFYHRFKPGLIRGEKVKVQMEIPIEFRLEKED